MFWNCGSVKVTVTLLAPAALALSIGRPEPVGGGDVLHHLVGVGDVVCGQGVPSLNLTPWRRVKVIAVPSVFQAKSVASHG